MVEALQLVRLVVFEAVDKPLASCMMVHISVYAFKMTVCVVTRTFALEESRCRTATFDEVRKLMTFVGCYPAWELYVSRVCSVTDIQCTNVFSMSNNMWYVLGDGLITCNATHIYHVNSTSNTIINCYYSPYAMFKSITKMHVIASWFEWCPQNRIPKLIA